MLKGDAVERFTYMFLEMWNVSEKGEEDYGKYKSPREAALPRDGFFLPYGSSPFSEEAYRQESIPGYLKHCLPVCAHHDALFDSRPRNDDGSGLCRQKRGGGDNYHASHSRQAVCFCGCQKPIIMSFWRQESKSGSIRRAFVHAKVFVSDDVRAVVGTVNLDYRSLYHHFECGGGYVLEFPDRCCGEGF